MVQNNISFPNTRKRYSAKAKFQAVLEMIRGEKTTGEIARVFGVHPTMLPRWRKIFMEKGPAIFEEGKGSETEKKIEELQRIIGKKETEIELLKKFLGHLNQA